MHEYNQIPQNDDTVTPSSELEVDVENGLGSAQHLLEPITRPTESHPWSFSLPRKTWRAVLEHRTRHAQDAWSIRLPKQWTSFHRLVAFLIIVTIAIPICYLSVYPPFRPGSVVVQQLPYHLSSPLHWPQPTHPSDASSLRYTAFQPSNTPLQDVLHSPTYPDDCLTSLFDPPPLAPFPPACIKSSSPSTKFDVVWTWVNGSDPLHRSTITDAEASIVAGRKLPRSEASSARLAFRRATYSAKLYRDHDELRYSLRSVLTNFRSHSTKFHVAAADFPMPPAAALVFKDPAMNLTVESIPTRLGQLPQWLAGEGAPVHDAEVPLDIHHHAQFFEDYEGTSFNSFAIESQLGRLGDLSEHFIYMNDDYFFNIPLTPADFYSPQYGIVLRMQPDLIVESQNPSWQDGQGEWRALQYSNWLLDRRFGARKRPYVTHAPKSMTLSLVHETVATFRDAILETSHHMFRSQHTGQANRDDSFLTFIFPHYIVERWREALLWSWAVARLGGDNDEWSAEAAWADLEVSGNSSFLHVTAGHRDTLDSEKIRSALGIKNLKTSYVFSSQDGYPYTFVTDTESHWPQFTADSPWSLSNSFAYWPPRCMIVREKCFPRGIKSASEAFKLIAFHDTDCGDCIIQALMLSSGTTGISSFLPPAQRSYKSKDSKSGTSTSRSNPRLPLASAWQKIDYSLTGALATSDGDETSVNVYYWVMQMLDKYRFVLGETPFEFLQVHNARDAESQLKLLDRTQNVAMFCVNDNLSPGSSDAASTVLQDWMDKKWPHKSGWES